MAPDAHVVSVKVAASNGAADVSQVIAAINWVDQHAHTDGLNIRVLNLSYGTDSAQPYTVDPLAYAAEQAWKHGILVVVAGGNDGTSRNVLADPAYDPTLLAVGADDPHSSPSAGDDSVADFSSNGNSSRHVDVVAPGTHVLGLRDPGSDADNGNASAVVGNRFFRGSGTSQAAAVVSGAAALLIQRYPNATPDQIKSLLVSNAQTFKNGNAQTRGAGVINVDAAIGKPLPTSTGQGFASATGTGQLDPARGGLDVQDDNGNLLTGEQDIFGNAWNASAWAAAVANQTTWGADGSWNGAVWTGTGFDGSTGSTWSGAAWTGVTWTGEAWSSHHWTSHHWTSDGWNGAAWTSDAWDSHHWTSENWSSFGWE
jgi:serine protease AprX